jgi:ABC-2 type transport system permease protein
MKETTLHFRNGLRVLGAIALKDIVDAVRNKTIFFNIVAVLLMMLAYQWLMTVMFDDDEIALYDAGNSSLVAALEDSTQFNMRRVSSIQQLKEEMATDPRGEVGLIVPSDFDQQLAEAALDGGQEPVLKAYVMWSGRWSADNLKAELEQQLADLIGQPVRIESNGIIRPEPDGMGATRMVAAMLVLVIGFMTFSTVPHLMFEEKQVKTLDALLVSPASINQVIAGKAVAGIFFCFIATAVVLTFNRAFVIHWDLALVATLCGTLMTVGSGLLSGVLFESREQMMIWVLIPGQLLLGPVFLSVFDVILPETIRTVMYWIPTVALARLFRYSFSNGFSLREFLFFLAIVLTTAVLVLGMVTWKVRRMDR